MLLKKNPITLFKYWFAGYTIGVFLAVAVIALENRRYFRFADSEEYNNDYDYIDGRYMCDHWIPSDEDLWTDPLPWTPPGISDIDYLMHIDKGDNRSVADVLAKRVRVFCIVMTLPKHRNRSLLVKHTWGKRCDGLIYMSTEGDESLPAVALNTSHDNPWGILKETFHYVYHHHGEEADWFVKTDDETYVIMENLKYMLNNYSSSEESYFGYMPDGQKDKEEPSKAGYVLSKAALKAIVEWGPYICSSNSKDYQFATCLHNLRVKKKDTYDSAGHARFFPYNPTLLHQSTTGASDFAISFHRITDNFMYVMEFFVYHLRAYGIVADYSVPKPYGRPAPNMSSD